MTRDVTVGIVFFALLAGLLGITLWVNDPSFGEEPAHVLDTRFKEVSGLRAGDKVWIYGTDAGRVMSIKPDGTGHVVVSLALDYDPELRENASISIGSSSALGGAVVEIHPGTPDHEPMTAAIVDGSVGGGLFGEVNRVISELEEPLDEAIENIRKVSADLAERSDEIVANVDGFMEDARAISGDLRAGKGTLGKLLQDETLYTDLQAAVQSLQKLADDANGGGGALDVLLHDPQLADDLKSTVANARSISDKIDGGEGTLGRLINDPTLYNDLTATVGDLKDMTAHARSGKGALGMLIYNEEVGQRIDDISKDVAQVTRKLRKGEGTLGKLIQDEDLYLELRDSLKALTSGAGDARENAPILTFASFLFGGF